MGAHSGLISWVDGMTPIFALYKKWQQRQATSPKKEKSPPNAASTTTKTTTSAKNTPPQAIPRPSELYFQKLTPLLSKHNLKATQSSRKEWPLEVLKQVLAELTGMRRKINLLSFLSAADHQLLLFLFFSSSPPTQLKLHAISYQKNYGSLLSIQILFSEHIKKSRRIHCFFLLLFH